MELTGAAQNENSDGADVKLGCLGMAQSSFRVPRVARRKIERYLIGFFESFHSDPKRISRTIGKRSASCASLLVETPANAAVVA